METNNLALYLILTTRGRKWRMKELLKKKFPTLFRVQHTVIDSKSEKSGTNTDREPHTRHSRLYYLDCYSIILYIYVLAIFWTVTFKGCYIGSGACKVFLLLQMMTADIRSWLSIIYLLLRSEGAI